MDKKMSRDILVDPPSLMSNLSQIGKEGNYRWPNGTQKNILKR